MKAIQFDKVGDPAEVLEVREVEAPKPSRGEVRARMLASPINPSDLLFVQGAYGKAPKLPSSAGFEGVGIVEESGGGLLGWRVKGRRVAVLNARGGNWQQQVVIPARQAVPVPQELSDEQAASFFVNPASALVMTQYVLRIPKGAWLLQSAANGALGRMVIRLANQNGFRTINIVRRVDQIEILKNLGADEVLCCKEEELIDQVQKITNGAGAPFAIDAVGGATASAMAQCLGHHGHMLVYGTLSEEPLSVHPRVLMVGAKRIEGFWLSEWVKDQGPLTMLRLFRRISRMFQSHVFETTVSHTFPMDQVKEAVTEAAKSGRQGKVLIRLNEQ